MGLEKKLNIFILINILVVMAIGVTLLFAWLTTNKSLTRMEYAEEIERTAFLLQRYIFTDNVSAIDSRTPWLESQKQLSTLLKAPPEFDSSQQTFLNSIKSKNESILILYKQLQRLSETPSQEDIRGHLKSRLVVQVESISEDSQGLASLAENEIKRNLQTQVITILLVLGFGLLLLIAGAQRLSRIFGNVFDSLQKGMKDTRKGKYRSIEEIQGADDFSEFISQFNKMNEQLEKTTVTRDVLQKIVDERTAVLKEIANTDPLTQVANRRALFERGVMEFNRAKRHQVEFSLLMLDCDFFKSVNDKYGHPVGDKLLIHLCQVCRKIIRDEDFIARYGGEEFVILLPHCNRAFGIEKAEAIRQAVIENGLFKDDIKIEFTVSIGVSSLNEKHKRFEELLSDADGALLKAKESGRNCVQVA